MTGGTEQPTDHKLSEAEKTGDRPHSRDFTVAFSMLAWWSALLALGKYAFASLQRFIQVLTASAAIGSWHFHAMRDLLHVLAGVLVPAAFALLLTLLFEFGQTRGALANKRQAFDVNRVNPVSGFKNLFGLKRLVELLFTLARFLLIAVIAWRVGTGMLVVLAHMSDRTWMDAAYLMSSSALKIVGITSLVCLCLAIIDLFLQRMLWRRRNKMKKEEIKREHKEQEGDPVIRGLRRMAHQELTGK